jgi:glutamate carboxypeptidase
LVNIDSPSGYVPGLTAVKDVLIGWLTNSGADLNVLPTPSGGSNLVASLTGSGKGRILLLAHADTVFKPGTATERPFRVENGRAYGPGVCDDKAAVVMAVYALKLLQESSFEDFAQITLLINSDEEICSLESRELIKELGQQHDYAICLEAGGVNNEIVSWRKGSARAVIEVTGRASHAGTSPEKGANALIELASQVLQIQQLADQEQGTSVSVTVFQSGDKINVIPDYAIAKIDIRAKYQAELDRIAQAGLELAKQRIIPDTEVSFRFIPNRPAFPANPATEELAGKVAELFQTVGLQTAGVGSGGGSDGNWTASVGTPTIDGMSFIGGNEHTDEEYLDLETIPARLYVLTKLIMDLGRKN